MKFQKAISWMLAIAVLFGWAKFAFSQSNFWQRTNAAFGFRIMTIAISAKGHVFAGTWGGGLWRSLNNGEHWVRIGADTLGSYISSLAINRNGEVFVGAAGGLLRSSDIGENWIALNAGLPIAHVNGIVIDSSNAIVISTLESGIFRSDTNGDAWRYLDRLDFFAFALTVNPRGHIFVATNCCRNAGNLRASIYRSLNGGDSWASVYQDPPSITGSIILTLAVTIRGEILAASVWNGLVRSLDNGMTWSIPPASPLNISSLATNSAGDIFAGQYGAGVLYSQNLGESWVEINSGLSSTNIMAIAFDGNGYAYVGDDSGRVFRSAPPTAVKEFLDNAPVHFALAQNYPNPFNPSTTFSFSLPRASFVTLKIYNLLGKEVATLVHEQREAGEHRVQWQPRDLPSGVYVFRLMGEDFSAMKKMLLMR